MTATHLTATTEEHPAPLQTQETHAPAGPHISIKAEPVISVAGFPVTNSLLLSLVVLAVFIALVAKYTADYTKRSKSDFFYFITFVLRGVYDLFQSTLGEKTARFFPLIGAFFFYILLNNWFGLLPGVGSVLYNHVPLLRANTADLNTTIALALIIMTYVQIVGIRSQGVNGYLGKFMNFSSPISFFVGILEIVSEFSRILSFSFRLFGNIFAGEVLLAVVAFLIPIAVSFPFLMLETFVGLIQAVVFAMLSAVLLKLAITKEH